MTDTEVIRLIVVAFLTLVGIMAFILNRCSKNQPEDEKPTSGTPDYVQWGMYNCPKCGRSYDSRVITCDCGHRSGDRLDYENYPG